MAGAIRLVSIERGHDPARFVAMPFGGGGALHVGALDPPDRAEMRAGAAISRHHVGARLRARRPAARRGADAQCHARRPRRAGARTAHARGRPGGQRGDRGRRYRGRADRRARTSSTCIISGRPTPLPCRCRSRRTVTASASPKAWSARRSRRPTSRRSAGCCPDLPMRIVTLRVAAIGRRPAFDFSVFAPGPSASLEKARLGSRPVWFDGGWRDTAVWARLDLPVGATDRGPAILEQPDATTVIEPGLAGPDRPARQSDRGAA